MADARNPPQPADAEPAPAELPCVWFWIPLPEPLALPNGLTFEEGADLDTGTFLRRGGHSVESSIHVHQVEDVASETATLMQALLQVAKNAVDRSPERVASAKRYPGVTDPPDEIRRRLTIVEMACMWPGGAGAESDDDEDDVSEAFDRALQSVRRLQQAYATVLQRAVRLVSLNTLPLFVPMSVGTVFVDEARLPSLGELSLFMTNPRALTREMPPEQLSGPHLEAVARILSLPGGGTPFAGFADLRREAFVQRDFDGNTRLAALTVGVAGETLLTTLLLHLMWEDQRASAEAAQLLTTKPNLTSRLQSEYHSRLGGRWNGSGPVVHYAQSVVNLRNRVAHTAHEPTRDEMHAAFDGLAALEHYIGDLLANEHNLNRYPRTAMAWMGEKGLSARGRWTRRMQQLTSDSAEPNWTVTFARWRFFVDAALSAEPVHPGSRLSQLRLFVDVYPDGDVRWLLYDSETHHAANAGRETARLDAETLNVVDRLVAYLLEDGIDTVVRTAVALDEAQLDVSGIDWVPEYELFADLGIFAGPPKGSTP